MAQLLRIRLDGAHQVIDGADFARVLQGTLLVLRHVAENPTKWNVAMISLSSPVSFELVGPEAHAHTPARVRLDSLRELENAGSRPAAFEAKALSCGT